MPAAPVAFCIARCCAFIFALAIACWPMLIGSSPSFFAIRLLAPMPVAASAASFAEMPVADSSAPLAELTTLPVF